jgi:hypothetical protein
MAPAFIAMATPRASAISSREAPAFRALSVWMVMQPSQWVVTATAREMSSRTLAPSFESLALAAERVWYRVRSRE